MRTVPVPECQTRHEQLLIAREDVDGLKSTEDVADAFSETPAQIGPSVIWGDHDTYVFESRTPEVDYVSSPDNPETEFTDLFLKKTRSFDGYDKQDSNRVHPRPFDLEGNHDTMESPGDEQTTRMKLLALLQQKRGRTNSQKCLFDPLNPRRDGSDSDNDASQRLRPVPYLYVIEVTPSTSPVPSVRDGDHGQISQSRARWPPSQDDGFHLFHSRHVRGLGPGLNYSPPISPALNTQAMGS